LAVDDSRSVRRILRKIFEPYVCEIIEAKNGKEGLDKVNIHRPDVILLDVSMPRMNGCRVLEKLKEDKELSSIPVIMLTADGGKKNMLKYMQLGAYAYLIKPFGSEEIVKIVSCLFPLEKKRQETEDRIPNKQ